MPFTLTPAHLDPILFLLSHGGFAALLAEAEPAAEWRFGAGGDRASGEESVHVGTLGLRLRRIRDRASRW